MLWWIIDLFTGGPLIRYLGGVRHNRVELQDKGVVESQHREQGEEQEHTDKQHDTQTQITPDESTTHSKQKNRPQLKGRRSTLLLLHCAKPKLRNRKRQKSRKAVGRTRGVPPPPPPPITQDTSNYKNCYSDCVATAYRCREDRRHTGTEYIISKQEDNTNTHSTEYSSALEDISTSIVSSSVSGLNSTSTEYDSVTVDFNTSSSVPSSHYYRNISVQYSSNSELFVLTSVKRTLTSVSDSDGHLDEVCVYNGNYFKCSCLKSNDSDKLAKHWE